MKPISFIYSYLKIPELNKLEIDIDLYNGLKELYGLTATLQNTKLLKIENHKACICDEFEYIKAVVVRKDIEEIAKTEYEVDENGNILIPNGTYPIVQQTINPQVHAIYPLLPYWFPNNIQTQIKTWSWAEPQEMLFEKQCKECPTYCNECEYVYSLTQSGCLYFPQIETGLACVNYNYLPEPDDILIDEKNIHLVNALVSYVQFKYWELRLNLEYNKQNLELFKYYENLWLVNSRKAKSREMLKSFHITSKINNYYTQ